MHLTHSLTAVIMLLPWADSVLALLLVLHCVCAYTVQ